MFDFLKKLCFRAKNAWIIGPYLWLTLFLLFPLGVILSISFSEIYLGSPPYTPLFSWISDHVLLIRLSLANYFFVVSDGLYHTAYLNSLMIAAISTFFCLLLGYPVAYGITRMPVRTKVIFLVLAIVPFGTSFLVRVYGWMNLLSPQGVINALLHYFGLQPVKLLNTPFAVILGITYSYLPFMIFPLYAGLEKIDPLLLEAANDLGCKPRQAFWKITFPLSLPGILAGSSLVFIPAVGEYIIPELLGGSTSVTIGRILWYEFFTNRDWPIACALAILMIVLLLIPILCFNKLNDIVDQDQS